jgi:PHD/YefM family antitoxin component YafN of YafNO toxin-antitoxin module
MPTVTATQARSRLHRLIAETASSHQPVLITGTQGNAVLVSEAVQETLYLLSIPGMRESIREGLRVPLDKCEDTLDW